MGALEIEPCDRKIGLGGGELGLGLANLGLANHKARGLLTRVELVPLLAGDHGLGLLALERDLSPRHGCLSPLEGELVVAWVDDHQHLVGAEETTGHQRPVNLHHLARHLRHDVHRDAGNDLAVAVDHHRHIPQLRRHHLDQGTECRPFDPVGRLAGGDDEGGCGHTDDENEKRKQTFEGFCGHQDTSRKLTVDS